ncbi:hypothetical protein KSX_85060 [Ktedonospora formicarum]|uniref:Uncharacterized protein n=1 Tax=Ktedonospora formicarum TaxID=2778364 RepID=A0A8J3IDL0_9CHLR|nr:hypothetical protein KSX_85060 [Ktedonospora formicarum]
MWQDGLATYDELVGIQWEWQAMDAAMNKSPFWRHRDWSKSHRSRQIGDKAKRVD